MLFNFMSLLSLCELSLLNLFMLFCVLFIVFFCLFFTLIMLMCAVLFGLLFVGERFLDVFVRFALLFLECFSVCCRCFALFLRFYCNLFAAHILFMLFLDFVFLFTIFFCFSMFILLSFIILFFIIGFFFYLFIMDFAALFIHLFIMCNLMHVFMTDFIYSLHYITN